MRLCSNVPVCVCVYVCVCVWEYVIVYRTALFVPKNSRDIMVIVGLYWRLVVRWD
jgi:hypothetical protein